MWDNNFLKLVIFAITSEYGIRLIFGHTNIITRL